MFSKIKTRQHAGLHGAKKPLAAWCCYSVYITFFCPKFFLTPSTSISFHLCLLALLLHTEQYNCMLFWACQDIFWNKNTGYSKGIKILIISCCLLSMLVTNPLYLHKARERVQIQQKEMHAYSPVSATWTKLLLQQEKDQFCIKLMQVIFFLDTVIQR